MQAAGKCTAGLWGWLPSGCNWSPPPPPARPASAHLPCPAAGPGPCNAQTPPPSRSPPAPADGGDSAGAEQGRWKMLENSACRHGNDSVAA